MRGRAAAGRGVKATGIDQARSNDRARALEVYTPGRVTAGPPHPTARHRHRRRRHQDRSRSRRWAGRGDRACPPRRRQPRGPWRTGRGEDAARADRGGPRRRSRAPGRHLPRHRRRRSADDNAIIHGIMRRIGARARLLVTNDALIALVAGAGVGPASSSSPAPARSPTGATRTTRRRGPVAGATSSPTKAADSGSAVRRCAPWCAPRTAAGRRRQLTPLVLDFFGVRAPSNSCARSTALPQAQRHRALCPAGASRRATAAMPSPAHIASVAADELSAAVRSVVRPARAGRRLPRGDGRRRVPRRTLAAGRAARAARGGARSPPRTHVHLLTTDPAIGAVRLALAEAQGGASIPTYKTRDHLAL